MSSKKVERLSDALADALPSGRSFKYHHASTVPAACPALYSPPPGRKPEKTYCETHLLHVSISPSNDHARQSIAVYAIEVYVYTTARLTTIFVSKADSTGYVPLLNLPTGTASVIKALSSTFISWLVRTRTRHDRPLVLSLFARAQEQYLFPGSAENKQKHVLDDRQLVKWWCRTLDPVLREYPGQEDEAVANLDEDVVRSQAYLIVPGQDRYETTAFFPATARQDPLERKRWKNGDPLKEISSHATAPPRCLVPHFPDDPKTRFLMELDEELQNVPPSQQTHEESPSKRGNGHWKGVKTLEQFWDMMAFRQECSSGRLTGFLWIVFRPEAARDDDDEPPSPSLKPSQLDSVRLPPPSTNLLPAPVTTHTPKPLDKRKKTPRKKLPLSTGVQKRAQTTERRKAKRRGPIVPRAPRIKTSSPSPRHLNIPARTAHYFCPADTRGAILLDQKAYNRVHEILCRLDFASPALAQASTAKWVRECAIIAGQAGADWGTTIVGRCALVAAPALVGAKRKAEGVHTLGMGVLRKKPKAEPAPDAPVNTLAAGLVRRKAPQ